MYAKCGSLEDVWRVFSKMPSCDVVSWNAILGGCAMHGHGKEALHFLKKVYSQMISPFLCSVSLKPCRFGG
jgi:pentatricopeptide repeat protein